MTFVVAIFVYLLFHAITGENGLMSYLNIKKQVDERGKALKTTSEELAIIKRRVELLSNQSLDLDLLEERCRIILNYCYPDEMVVRDLN
ncbi:MAG: septum formation initiator family protein [Holosporales bacterium]|nr:septum formation initiator family protein [Holosporales bacterium]